MATLGDQIARGQTSSAGKQIHDCNNYQLDPDLFMPGP
jgi:hypothetical protein